MKYRLYHRFVAGRYNEEDPLWLDPAVYEIDEVPADDRPTLLAQLAAVTDRHTSAGRPDALVAPPLMPGDVIAATLHDGAVRFYAIAGNDFLPVFTPADTVLEHPGYLEAKTAALGC